MNNEEPTIARQYRNKIVTMLDAIIADPAMDKAIDAVATALASDHIIHVAGSGHSHMLAEEVFYRAGGIAAAQAILEPELMLHLGARRSTRAERQEGTAERVLARYRISKGDVVFIASNSGRNAYSIELALAAGSRGATTIAITSMAAAATATSRHSSGKLLRDVADMALDNCVPPGDATTMIPGLGGAMAPASTIMGVFMLNTILAEAAARVAERGGRVDIYQSANSPGNVSPDDIANRWQHRISGL